VNSIIQGEGWQKIAVLSNNYLLPRIEHFFTGELTLSGTKVAIDYVGAEERLLFYDSTRYGRVIFRYTTLGNPEYVERLGHEFKGIHDRNSDRYVIDKY
jgi:hypothetical protein